MILYVLAGGGATVAAGLFSAAATAGSGSDSTTLALGGIAVSVAGALTWYFKQTSAATERRAQAKDAQVTELHEARLADERRHSEEAYKAIATVGEAVKLLNEDRRAMQTPSRARRQG